jgi:hypothetical protein
LEVEDVLQSLTSCRKNQIQEEMHILIDVSNGADTESVVVGFSTKIPPGELPLVEAAWVAASTGEDNAVVVPAAIVGIVVDTGPIGRVTQRLGSGTVSNVVMKGGLPPRVRKLIFTTF